MSRVAHVQADARVAAHWSARVVPTWADSWVSCTIEIQSRTCRAAHIQTPCAFVLASIFQSLKGFSLDGAFVQMSVSGVSEGSNVEIECVLDGVYPNAAWKKLTQTGMNEPIGPLWASYCKDAGVDVVKCDCMEGGVCSADRSRQIRLDDNPTFRRAIDAELTVHPRGDPVVRAHVHRGAGPQEAPRR